MKRLVGLSVFSNVASMVTQAQYERARVLHNSGKRDMQTSAEKLVDAIEKRERKKAKRAKEAAQVGRTQGNKTLR